MTKEAKTQIVIDNYFKSECDVNTSIRKAFEKGFRIGVQKGSVAAEPVKHGHWTDNGHIGKRRWCSLCGGIAFEQYDDYGLVEVTESDYCPHCGAYMGVEE